MVIRKCFMRGYGIQKRKRCRLGGRPPASRKVNFKPGITYFKPGGVPVSELELAEISCEELEALRLRDVEDLSQEVCAERMETSQSTFQRILKNAHQKVSKALVESWAIRVDENNKI